MEFCYLDILILALDFTSDLDGLLGTGFSLPPETTKNLDKIYEMMAVKVLSIKEQ